MNTLEDISGIFAIFHDGGIATYSWTGRNLTLEVDIEYLAELVCPEFRMFRVRLCDVSQLEFTTWPKHADEPPLILIRSEDIFAGELEILDSEVLNDRVKIICNQSAVGLGYCGGKLLFHASSAWVEDQVGRLCTLDELKRLSKKYWSDWELRNRRK